MTLRKLSIFFLFMLLMVMLVQPATAQQINPNLAFDVFVGFDGYSKSNAWTPVRISASNSGPDVNGEVRLQADFPGETYAQALSLPSQSEKEIILYVPLRNNEFVLQFVSEGQTIHQSNHRFRILSPTSYLVGVIAPNADLLNFLAGLQTQQGEPLSVAHLSLNDLPEERQGLSALDALVINDTDTSALTTAQQSVLTSWTAAGGHLIVGGGPGGQLAAAGVLDLLPVSDIVPATLLTLPALGEYINEPVPTQGPFLAAVPQATSGSVYLEQDGAPLLVHQPFGQGEVTYFALDFGLAPMNAWAGNDLFWERLLGPNTGALPFYTTFEAMRSINNALANIDIATLPRPAGLVAFLCLYVLILVPINYWVLKGLKRRELAWITIPVLILLFTLTGYIAGFRARGGRALLRQVSVVQQTNMTAANGLEASATVDTFIGLYSPSRDRYTLRFADELLVQPTNDGSGYQAVRTTASAPTTIYYGNPTELQNLWTDVGSMATAIVHGETQPRSISADIELIRRGTGWHATGVVNNDSALPLEDAMLLVGEFGVKLPSIQPGQTNINHVLQSLNVRQSYSDQTLWGDFYYQLEDPEDVLNDQIIRSVFWPDAAVFIPQSQTTPATAEPDNEVVILGWQTGGSPEMDIEVVGHRVDRDAFNLVIVRMPL